MICSLVITRGCFQLVSDKCQKAVIEARATFCRHIDEICLLTRYVLCNTIHAE